MEEDETAHGRHGHGPGHGHAEEPRGQVDLANVDENVLADGETVEGAAIPLARHLGLGGAVAEVPRVAGQDLLRVLPDLWEGDEFVGHGSVQYCGAALHVKQHFLPKRMGPVPFDSAKAR